MAVYAKNLDGSFTCVVADITASITEQTIREGLMLDTSVCSQQIANGVNLAPIETNVIEDAGNE